MNTPPLTPDALAELRGPLCPRCNAYPRLAGHAPGCPNRERTEK